MNASALPWTHEAASEGAGETVSVESQAVSGCATSMTMLKKNDYYALFLTTRMLSAAGLVFQGAPYPGYCSLRFEDSGEEDTQSVGLC